MAQCERVIQLIRGSNITSQEAFELERWLRQLAGASHYIPTEESALATKTAAKASGLPIPGEERPRRKLSRAERVAQERHEAHQRQVDALFGERPLLPSERAALAPYEPM